MLQPTEGLSDRVYESRKHRAKQHFMLRAFRIFELNVFFMFNKFYFLSSLPQQLHSIFLCL